MARGCAAVFRVVAEEVACPVQGFDHLAELSVGEAVFGHCPAVAEVYVGGEGHGLDSVAHGQKLRQQHAVFAEAVVHERHVFAAFKETAVEERTPDGAERTVHNCELIAARVGGEGGGAACARAASGGSLEIEVGGSDVGVGALRGIVELFEGAVGQIVVAVAEEEVLALGVLVAGLSGHHQAFVLLLGDDFHARVAGGVFAEYFSGAIRGCVVHAYYLNILERLPEHGVEAASEVFFDVVDRDKHGDFRA